MKEFNVGAGDGIALFKCILITAKAEIGGCSDRAERGNRQEIVTAGHLLGIIFHSAGVVGCMRTGQRAIHQCNLVVSAHGAQRLIFGPEIFTL
jgi:hypothetical protein